MSTGIDATVELVAELDRLSSSNQAARDAPRSKALYQYLGAGAAAGPRLVGPDPDEVRALTLHLIERLGIWWSRGAYAAMPVMTPWCVRDRSCRYDQGPESWGAPREDGFLRDDNNSIIKKLPLPLVVNAPDGHPFAGRKPWRGFTACHIWRDLPGGMVAGEDPWLYSFIPNLIWLPSWLAPLTDRQDSWVQAVLQGTSRERYLGVPVAEPVKSYADYGWQRLPAPRDDVRLDPHEVPEFSADAGFFRRRLRYLDDFVAGCDRVLAGQSLEKRLICSRYTVGLPALAAEPVTAFREQIAGYAGAVRTALSSVAA